MRIPDFARVCIAELSAFLAVAWIGVALWHYTKPPEDAWWGTTWAFTCAFIGIVGGIIVAIGIWRATEASDAGESSV